MQVCSHLLAAARWSNVRVVALVGGMALQKQQRQLQRQRPEIVVGTPGRLWELMSSGEPHLQEVPSPSPPSLRMPLPGSCSREAHNVPRHSMAISATGVPGRLVQMSCSPRDGPQKSFKR